MDLQQLDYFIRKEEHVEIIQKFNNKESTIEDSDKNYLTTLEDNDEFSVTKNLFLKDRNVYINKHHRYGHMALHNHEFVEINYMYSGQCVQRIQGKEITLNQGEMCILDRNIFHRIRPLKENDILINILIKSESVNTIILENMANDRNLLTEFFIHAAQGGSSHNQFLVLECGENEKVQGLIKNIIGEYYSNDKYSMEIISLSLPILFMELARSGDNNNIYVYRENGSGVIIKALKIIEKQYKIITLSYLAKQLGFNKNYLSNLIKKETGDTFSHLVLRQRLLKAYELILNSDYSMDDITSMVGLSSTSYFFKVFKKYFGQNPGSLRRKNL